MELAVLAQKLAVRQKRKQVEAASVHNYAIFSRLKTKLTYCAFSLFVYPQLPKLWPGAYPLAGCWRGKHGLLDMAGQKANDRSWGASYRVDSKPDSCRFVDRFVALYGLF